MKSRKAEKKIPSLVFRENIKLLILISLTQLGLYALYVLFIVNNKAAMFIVNNKAAKSQTNKFQGLLTKVFSIYISGEQHIKSLFNP